jgi:hypothetical protein
MHRPEGRLSNHQPCYLGTRKSPLPAKPGPGPIDVVVGALLEILAAEILDGARVAADTFHKNRIETGEFAHFGNHFIWTIFKEKHRFILDIFSGVSARWDQALCKIIWTLIGLSAKKIRLFFRKFSPVEFGDIFGPPRLNCWLDLLVKYLCMAI